jgi:carboxyl-terminal processing protease
MARKKLYLFLLPLIVVACSVTAGLFGTQVLVANAATPNAELAMGRDIENFTKVYALIEQNAAEKPDADKAIYHGAIPGMLRTLDPHSNFFDPKEYRALREEQSGTYYGVGMHVAQRGGKVVVVAPFPGSPAYKAGLRPGDIIAKVDGKSTDGMNVTEVADLLKGQRGTIVNVAVSREGSSGNLTFQVTRDEISRKSVPDGFFVQPGIAYIKIESFAENTARELEDDLKQLGENNIKGLILDLRANPGGLLNSGVAVADHFLQKGQLIVSHHGRSSPEKAYSAYNGNHGRNYPIVVLVDRYTASAAEIVSGALQDHDRAWVLGETTFGKGLVQTVFPLYEHTGLALTTAHFYTPSGRLIQRDYTNKSFYDYYFHKDDNARNPQDVKMTDSGRTVYGGGGITPDEKYQEPKLDTLEGELLRNGFFSFTRDYFATHPASSLQKGWMPSADVIEDLHDFLLKKGTKFTEADFTKDHDWIRRYLAREMYIYAFGEDESNRMFAATDPEVQKAIDAMPQAQALADTARKVIVERMNGLTPRPGVAHR